MSTNIYWFSGTGNSLYTAKRLAEELGDTSLYPMAGPVPSGTIDAEKIGFVFPSYYSNLPRAVRSFTEGLKIREGVYLFTVVTGGGLWQGSVAELESLLGKKNLRLNYGRGIIICGNYIINYNPADLQKVEGKLIKIDAKIKNYAADIKNSVQSIKKINLTANNLYKNIESLDTNFFAEHTCTGCGQCAKLCPVKNISMQKSRPQWLHHCEHCVACISWCPAQAIQYGVKTKKRRRYRNPAIGVNDLIIR